MGMILGEAGVNIASMRLGRVEPGGEVLTFIKIDNEASPETIARLEATEPIKRVRQVVL
jgi:D-3-phosphoglycerate dehydrogenase